MKYVIGQDVIEQILIPRMYSRNLFENAFELTFTDLIDHRLAIEKFEYDLGIYKIGPKQVKKRRRK